MTSRERVRAALNHQQPDQIPFDLGGCGQTGMNASTLYRLRKALGLEERPVEVCEPYQLLGSIDEDVRQALGVDVIPLWNPTNLMGTSNNKTQLWHMPDGTPVLMSDDFAYDVAPDGSTYAYPQGDRSVPYSLHLPKNGFFFDNIDRAPEFDEDNLTPVEDFKEQYTVVPQSTVDYWAAKSKELYENTEYSIMGVLGGMGLGDGAEIPGPFMKHPKGIRDMQNWLIAMAAYPEYIEAVFELQTEVMLKNLELYKSAVGDRIDSIFVSGTDFGTQNSTFVSIDMFRRLFKPYYKRVNDWIHQNTNWKTYYHTCGSVFPLIPDLIEMGVDILNPVQCSAKDMDAQRLKDMYGNDITFWGGGVNTQVTLPFGTPDEVYREVRERCEIFAPNGGFIFAAIHNVVGKVPVENMLAMYRALDEARGRI